VTTLKADNRKRVRIPDATPGQVFVYEREADGRITLTLVVKAEWKERFSKGSLLKYFTPERATEELAIQAGCSLEAPE